MAKFMAPTQGIVFDEPSGKYLDSSGKPWVGPLPVGAEIRTRSHPPRMPQQRQPMYIGNDDKGNPVYWDPFTNEKVAHSGVTRPGATNSNQSILGSLNIPTPFLDDIQLKMDVITNDPRGVDESDIASFRNAMSQGFREAKIKATPAARQLAMALLNKGTGEHQAYVKQQLAAGAATIADVEDALNMYSSLPQQIRDVMAANPYDPLKKERTWWETINIFDGK